VIARRTSGLALAMALIAGIAACASSDPLLPNGDEAFVYVILDPSTSNQAGTYDQYAVVLTAGTPALSPCRDVQRFSMARARDRASFAWRIQPECLEGAGTDGIGTLGESCCVLPEQAPADSLGVNDLRGGERYDLEIATEGVTVTGSLVLPDTFSIRVITLPDGRRAATWPPVRGAAAYLVDGVFLTDTVRVLPPEGGILEVQALDANLYAYLRDETSARAGVENARGVFGAVTRAGLVFYVFKDPRIPD
jgi:hypothetical protein